jgi:hypothetical protein
MILPVPEEKFSQFLCDAKRATYAAQDEKTKVKPILKGSHQLEFRQGALLYQDIYYGGGFFVGQETVYFNDEPVWAMCYAGGLVAEVDPSDTPEIYTFLREALKDVPIDAPYRGPESFQQDVFFYSNRILGNVARFSGVEMINHEGKPIYQLHYNGGILKE